MTRTLLCTVGFTVGLLFAVGCGDDGGGGPNGNLICSTDLPCVLSDASIVACADTANNCFWEVGDQLVSCGPCDDEQGVEMCTDEALDLCESLGGTGGGGTGEISAALEACRNSCDCLDPEVQGECRDVCDTPVAEAAAAGCLAEEAAYWNCFGEIRCGGFGCGDEGEARRECLGTGPIGGVTGDINDNNFARLSGAPLGDGTEDVANLRKTVPVSVLAANPNLEVASSAYVFRDSTLTESARWYLEVTNRSQRRACSVIADDVLLKDGDGRELDFGLGLLTGNVGKVDEDRWTDTCLDPGASGPFLEIHFEDVYTAVASIEIASISLSVNREDAPPAIVRPTSYSIGESSAFEVTVENTGTETAYVDSLSQYVLLDDAGAPLWWGFVEVDGEGEGEIGPGETLELNEDVVRYDGQATSVEVYVDFEAEP